MKIYFSVQASADVVGKIGSINKYDSQILECFGNKFYSYDLENLYIGLFCMSPNFEPFFAPYNPKYTPETKTVINQGIPVTKEAKTYEYETRLDFSRYSSSHEFKSLLASDIIASLDIIQTCKKIKDLDLMRMKVDFHDFFISIGWVL